MWFFDESGQLVVIYTISVEATEVELAYFDGETWDDDDVLPQPSRGNIQTAFQSNGAIFILEQWFGEPIIFEVLDEGEWHSPKLANGQLHSRPGDLFISENGRVIYASSEDGPCAGGGCQWIEVLPSELRLVSEQCLTIDE